MNKARLISYTHDATGRDIYYLLNSNINENDEITNFYIPNVLNSTFEVNNTIRPWFRIPKCNKHKASDPIELQLDFKLEGGKAIFDADYYSHLTLNLAENKLIVDEEAVGKFEYKTYGKNIYPDITSDEIGQIEDVLMFDDAQNLEYHKLIAEDLKRENLTLTEYRTIGDMLRKLNKGEIVDTPIINAMKWFEKRKLICKQVGIIWRVYPKKLRSNLWKIFTLLMNGILKIKTQGLNTLSMVVIKKKSMRLKS